MNAQRTPVVDLSPLGLVKTIDRQRATLPHCTVQLMPAEADVVRAALMRQVDAAAKAEAELERARALVAADGRVDALAGDA